MAPATDPGPARLEAKRLYRRLDHLFGAWDRSRPQGEMLESFLDELFGSLKEDLRLRGVVLYGERRDEFERMKVVGDPGGGLMAEELDRGSAPLGLIFKHRVYIFADPDAEGTPYRLGLLPRAPVAGILVGRRPDRHLFFFMLADGWVREELDFALNTVRAALTSRLIEERARDTFEEAAEIQQSLLLEEAPDFSGYDIACKSIPAEEVGGDFFDFMSFDAEMLGVAIGDASGHGLPAALLVRDVVTGLRMGIEKDMKMGYAFAKLNRVIHRSNLSSRFVSVFYGELEANGNFLFVNAGHQPPLLFLEYQVVPLTTGGTVIGPLPEVQFKRGYVHIDRGSILLMCTDGIVERRNPAGEFYGEERLRLLVSSMRDATAQKVLDKIFEDVFAWGHQSPWEDDATVVVVRRLEKSEMPPAKPSLEKTP
jgi:sigma-B regulation protein RsbU (phosphoserine phosphatase)